VSPSYPGWAKDRRYQLRVDSITHACRKDTLHQALYQAGIKNVWWEGPGLHEWQVWRKHLHAFAPLLFR